MGGKGYRLLSFYRYRSTVNWCCGIAGVDPRVGLYASFCIATVIAFAGGRPGMVFASTGAMALLMVTLVKDHGLQYLLAATVLTGVLQIFSGWLKLGALMRFVSHSVVIGFVNALAIIYLFRHRLLNQAICSKGYKVEVIK